MSSQINKNFLNYAKIGFDKKIVILFQNKI